MNLENNNINLIGTHGKRKHRIAFDYDKNNKISRATRKYLCDTFDYYASSFKIDGEGTVAWMEVHNELVAQYGESGLEPKLDNKASTPAARFEPFARMYKTHLQEKKQVI